MECCFCEKIEEKLGPFDGYYYTRGHYHDQYSINFTPFAMTFTLPPEVKIPMKPTIMGKVVNIFEQMEYLCKKIKAWENAVNSLLPRSTPITRIMVFFEHTQVKQIHGHGICFINNNYIKGISQIMALQWARISKAKLCAMSKNNGRGQIDHAFDKCNNVESWMTYIQKEQTEKREYINDYDIERICDSEDDEDLLPCENEI